MKCDKCKIRKAVLKVDGKWWCDKCFKDFQKSPRYKNSVIATWEVEIDRQERVKIKQ